MSAFHWNSLQVRLAGRLVGSGGSSRRWLQVVGTNNGGKLRGKSNTIRSLMPEIVWFDGAVEAYMAPRLANALGRTGATIRLIARRSIRKHRRKREAELTPYERDYRRWRGYTKRDSMPPMPGVPGGPARYSEQFGVNFRESVLYGYDPSTRSIVVGPVALAGSGARRRKVPELLEEGGMAPVSYGYNKGRMAYVKARPTMRLALAQALPRIERFFAMDGTPPMISGTSGRNAIVGFKTG